MINPRGGDFYLAISGDRNLAVDRGGSGDHPNLRLYLDWLSALR
jgi:hypothetical protein